MQRIFVTLIAALLALACSNYAGSTEPPRMDEKRQERMEMLRKWKMMEALDLDKDTAEKIFALRGKYLAERKKFRDAVAEDLRRLKQLLRDQKEKPDDKELERLVSSIRQNRKKLRANWDESYEEVSKLLTIRQQAELILFLKEFNQSARAMFRQPGGPMQPPPGAGPGQRFRPRQMPPPEGDMRGPGPLPRGQHVPDAPPEEHPDAEGDG